MEQKKSKYYEFKNITPTSADLYIYGEIVEESWELWDEDSGVALTDFKKDLDELQGITDLNIYINSGGGSVFASSTMVSLLERQKLKGTKIHTFIDGLCASASTFIFFAGDDLNVYENSIAMIHKPMTISVGNANDLQKDIDTLNKIEDSVMLPLYEKKAKVDNNEIKAMIDNETWLTAGEIVEKFNVNLINQTKQVVASIGDKYKSVYKHIPKQLQANTEPTEAPKEETPKAEETKPEEAKIEATATNEAEQPKVEAVDYSVYDNKIRTLYENKIKTLKKEN